MEACKILFQRGNIEKELDEVLEKKEMNIYEVLAFMFLIIKDAEDMEKVAKRA